MTTVNIVFFALGKKDTEKGIQLDKCLYNDVCLYNRAVEVGFKNLVFRFLKT